MTPQQIKKEQARFGSTRAGDVIGTDRDDIFSIRSEIPHDKTRHIDLNVAPGVVRGKRVCYVEAWIMEEEAPESWHSTQHAQAGPFSVSTPIADLVPIAYGLIPTLKAQEAVLPMFSCQMFDALKRSKHDKPLLDRIQHAIDNARKQFAP